MNIFPYHNCLIDLGLARLVWVFLALRMKKSLCLDVILMRGIYPPEAIDYIPRLEEYSFCVE